MLKIPNKKIGRKKREIIPCKCFFQKISLMNYLHNFFNYLFGDFLVRMKRTRKTMHKTIRIKYKWPITRRKELSCIVE